MPGRRRARRRLTRPQKWAVGLGVLLLALGLGNLGRAAAALRTAASLPDLPLTVPLDYLAATAAFWGVALTVCAGGLMRFRPWGRWTTLAAATLYEVHVWVNHLSFDASDYALQTRPRDLALTATFMVLVWGLLHWPSVRRVFAGVEVREAGHGR